MTPREFCIKVHTVQRQTPRGPEPYSSHPIRVAEMVEQWGGTQVQVDAAYLHDVLEDTPTTYLELADLFGAEVANSVLALTDVFTPAAYPNHNRATRKVFEAERIAQLPYVHLVKLCDLLDNLRDTVNEKFKPVFHSEVRVMLSKLEGPDALCRIVAEACDS